MDRMPSPAHPTPPRILLANAGLVLVGGALGAALRILVLRLFPLQGELGLLVVNVTGAFALAWLTAWALRGTRRERLRLLLGTGACGGYTSYSGILLAPAGLIAPLQLAWLPVALLTIVLGLGASALGWWAGAGRPGFGMRAAGPGAAPESPAPEPEAGRS